MPIGKVGVDLKIQKRGLPMQHSKSKDVVNMIARMYNSSPRHMRENRYAILVQCLEFPTFSTYKRAYRFLFTKM